MENFNILIVVLMMLYVIEFELPYGIEITCAEGVSVEECMNPSFSEEKEDQYNKEKKAALQLQRAGFSTWQIFEILSITDQSCFR